MENKLSDLDNVHLGEPDPWESYKSNCRTGKDATEPQEGVFHGLEEPFLGCTRSGRSQCQPARYKRVGHLARVIEIVSDRRPDPNTETRQHGNPRRKS